MADPGEWTELELRRVEQATDDEGAEQLVLHPDGGAIRCRFHAAPTGDAAVLWVFGAGGGLGGPAGGVYPRLARQLLGDGIASLELDYRRPAHLADCVRDVLFGISYLRTRGRRRIVLGGHSFGGAVVITAGAMSGVVVAVAALSSQVRGTEPVDRISPRPLLVLHGTADEVLPDRCAQDIYRRAQEPKRLVLYPGCRHGLDDCRAELDRDLLSWIRDAVARNATQADT